ncbi:MAG: Fic family protein [Candidatus Woesearchaeota archaeon]
MYIEARKSGKKTKYYLVHAYRDKENEVRKIRRYLGADLSERQLAKLKNGAEKHILQQIKEIETDVFEFSLSPREVEQLNKYSDKIEIHHLTKEEWVRFTEEFVYNTNAIEGSSVLPDEVPKILEMKRVSNPEEIETKGVAEAIAFIRTAKMCISENLLLKLHKLCFDKSKPFAGKFREVEVVIRDREGNVVHQGVLSKELDSALREMVSWYHDNKKRFKPLVLAAIIHNQFEHIHPFQDGNGRVGRLLLNYILLKNDYPPINIQLEDRAEYYQTLQKYHHSQDIKSTLRFLIKQYKKTLKQVTTRKKKS